jgi:hypothetical protein
MDQDCKTIKDARYPQLLEIAVTKIAVKKDRAHQIGNWRKPS